MSDMPINKKIDAIRDLLGDSHAADILIKVMSDYHEDFEADNPQRRIVHLADDYVGITRPSGFRSYHPLTTSRQRVKRLCAGRRSVVFAGDERYAFNARMNTASDSEWGA